MAAPWNPARKNASFETNFALRDYNNPGLLKANPTLAAGDVTICADDDTTPDNITTLPTVDGTSVCLRVQLSQTEMNHDKLMVIFRDQTSPPEWCDAFFVINTTA